MNRCFLAVFSLCLGCLLSVCNSPSEAAERRPNIVIFLADDAGWGDYSRNGNQMVRTPHIDSIARDGITLDRFFVCPVCSPTRAEFLTGRYHPRGGVRGVSTGQERLDLNERTFADALKAEHYATGAFGKWHNGTQWPYHPMARGFDEYFGHSSGHWGEYFDAPLEHNGRMIRTKGYIVDVCTDRALDFIERNQSRPFLCYVPFTTPHSPWGVPESNWQRFKDLPLTQTATQPDQEQPRETRCALAMIENQDANVGRVLQKLRDLNIAEDTIVVYFSDNGPNTWRWNGGMKGRKGSVDEGGVRSTCFVRWSQKLPAGQTVAQIAGAIDLLPTLLSLAGVPRVGEKPLDGRDLTPLLLGKSVGSDSVATQKQQPVEWPDRMLFSTWANKVSVRTQRYRLDDQGQLFDMQRDPGQTTPIQERERATADRLADAVKAWRQEVLAPTTKGPKKSGGNAVDPRPIHVGFSEFPITMLPARDGEPQGTVKRSSSAPNCSYFVNWTSKEDRLVWNIDVQQAGRYEVVVDYTCPLADAGSLIELSHLQAKLTARVQPGWDPPLLTNQDTIPRPAAESTMKEFKSLKLGEITLEKGTGPLVLRALEIPGRSVMDLRRVTLTILK